MNNNQYPRYKHRYPIGDVHFNTKEKISIMTGKESYLKDAVLEYKKRLSNEYGGSEPIQKFINEYYYDIVECSLLAEKELPLLDKGKFSLAPIAGILSGYVVTCYGSGVLSAIGGLGIFVLSCILPIAHSFIIKVRRSKFLADVKDLFKIKSALEKIYTLQIPDKYREYVEELIILIDPIEEKLVNTKECVEIKLKIHEAFIDGAITESQRDILLDMIVDRNNNPTQIWDFIGEKTSF